MTTPAYVTLMASYNAWMNGKLYAAASTLPHQELVAPRGAFFGSIQGTLNHVVVADTIWLSRFAMHPSKSPVLAELAALKPPAALDEVAFHDFTALTEHRQRLDDLITRWAASLTDDDLAATLSYSNMKGVPSARPMGGVVVHFFNHQTHHRGQATTLLSQAGLDVGVTDLLALVGDDLVETAHR